MPLKGGKKKKKKKKKLFWKFGKFTLENVKKAL